MRWFALIVLIVFVGCESKESDKPALFSNVTTESGVSFQNNLTITEQLNPYTYRNFYNGAGVAIGDINNDGLQDIYFAGNQVDNRLYLNTGNFTFKDITATAGVACSGVWSTGVAFADINADGLLDIYVCKSGNPDAPKRHNELFINNGDLTFTERAKEYGLDIVGLSVQAAFFDFDRDSDLDCYLLTNSFKSVGNFDLVKDQRSIPDPMGGGNKFLVNEDGKFRDHTAQAGIYSSSIGFGLGITLGDFNADHWTDIFVSNDFFERDYLYINNQDGTFDESLPDYFESISMGSMGADYADLDNDAIPELFVTEMLPDSLQRKKTKTVYESWNKYQLNLSNGYHYQFSRNVLQKKTGPGNFAEIGRLAGLAASEWSWGALLFDMNNDGLRDVFIANGIYKDLLDRDYLAYSVSEDNVRKIVNRDDQNAILKLIDLMPSSKFSNYAFVNRGNLRFENVAADWGLAAPMYSSGSAYGDLDNDGDLDLVVSNLNAPAAVYRNNTDSLNSSISFTVSMPGGNRFGVGTEVTAFSGNRTFHGDNFVTRGFQSNVTSVITIGLGTDVDRIDSVRVHWPDGALSTLYNLLPGRNHVLDREQLGTGPMDTPVATPALPFTLERLDAKVFRHRGSGLVDFNRDRLLPVMYSNESPSMIKGDVNNDGVEDVYVSGGKDQVGVFIDFSGSKISAWSPEAMREFQISEETKSALADFDGDGDPDIYLSMGGRFFPGTSSALTDRILLNDGRGNFSRSPNELPFKTFISTSVARAVDIDRDGDPDLVVAERFDPFVYGTGGRCYLLENDGKGKFRDITHRNAPMMVDMGMVTDIEIRDYDNDGSQDIFVVGDWMPIVALKNENGHFRDVSDELGLSATHGWWNDIEAGDFNKDGRVDFVVGNHGLNSFFKEGDRMYVDDFDSNGSVEQIYCTRIGEKYFPVADKDDLLSQIPSIKNSILYYKDYAKKSIEELMGEERVAHARILQTNVMASSLLLSGSQGYTVIDMPMQAQYAPIHTLLVGDFDNDGVEDVIAGGNQYLVKPQYGRYDASHGWFFKGALTGGSFTLSPGIDLNVSGQIRDIEMVEYNNTTYLLFAKHDNELEIFRMHR